MKRRDLDKKITEIAKNHNAVVEITHGGSHDHCKINGLPITTLPRHREINEMTARGILNKLRKHLEE
ncbi:MAG: hypothetical protein B5766_00655 [Candidatus Lumbricidophila eiseniae]|uniref:Addiction module toxin, HicA family n=1 Tax=Candidatus Lumbricidiphila eiseniae TaxID=1969409 RepID=A0A2A6FV06_9MICO|nr:MAG: hypothetical protein B5766_00655 [Candidatus Lumbricidophila eiseniae]